MAQRHAARQVFDVPEPLPLMVTEHRGPFLPMRRLRPRDARGLSRRRLQCARMLQYGARIAAFVVYLLALPISARGAP